MSLGRPAALPTIDSDSNLALHICYILTFITKPVVSDIDRFLLVPSDFLNSEWFTLISYILSTGRFITAIRNHNIYMDMNFHPATTHQA